MNKIIAFLLSWLLMSPGCSGGGAAFAQTDSQSGIWDITDFSGGLQSHISPFDTPKKAFTDALNVRVNTKYGAIAKRSKMLLLSQCHSAPVKSLYRYYKSDNTTYILQTSSTYLDYISDTSGTCTQLLTGLTDGKRWNWVTYKDVAIGTNGTDAAIKWDGALTTTADTAGARTAGDLVAQLGAPFAKLAAGTDLTSAKWYQYRVAFYDGSVYKYSTARSNPILTGATVHDINLSDIPLGPTGTTSRIIYRTLGDNSRTAVLADTTFYKVASISDNSTRTYSDTASDATISADAAPTWATVSAGINATPPKSRFAVIHQERLFLGNDPSGTVSGKSTIYWSDILNPDYFNTATDYELVRPDDGDEITVLKNLYNILTIGKTNTWSKFYTDSTTSSAWTLSDPFDYNGAVAPYSAVNGTGGIYYVSRFGLRVFNGQTSQLISDVVTDKVRDINPTNLNEVVGAFQDNQYQVSYTSSDSGSAINDQVLVLDLTRNAYVLDAKNIDSFAVFSSSTDTGTLYSGSSSTDGAVYAHSASFSTLTERYKSDLDAGTFSSTRSNGTEDDSTLSLGSTATWASDSSAWNSESVTTWLVDASPGTWTSPIIQIDASKLEKIYWNERLGSYGDVTFAVRTGATTGAVSAASWSSEVSSPSGSDISGTSASKYIQIRATLSTSNFTETPYVFLDDNFIIKVTYDKSGSSGESSILSFLQTGYTDLGVPNNPKTIKEIQIHYTGTSGTMTVGIVNDENVTSSFNIDLSVDPTTSSTDQYYGTRTDKIYVYIPPLSAMPAARKFKFSVTENGTTDWQIRRLAVRFDAGRYMTYQR